MTFSAISAVLAADLHELLSELSVAQFDLPSSAAVLRRDLRLAVRSALGFSLTVRGPLQLPVTLHVVDAPLHRDHVASSLRLPLGPTAADTAGTTVAFYADRPGALVDLAADLTAALRLPLTAAELDGPLPTEVISSGVVGLADFTVVSRAVGVLIAQGLTVAEARTALASPDDGHSLVPAACDVLTNARGSTPPSPTRPFRSTDLPSEDQQ